MPTQVVYLSHPIGPASHVEDLMRRHDNIAIAGAWMRYLVRRTRWALVSPVLAFCSALDSTDTHSPRALTDQIAILERCDFVVQIGGTLSPHMVIERNHAARRHIPVVDLLFMGTYPPHDDDEGAQGIIERHVLDVALVGKRAPWLPPLAQGDVEKLRQAQLVLAAEPNMDEVVMLLQRIVSALHVEAK